MKTLKKQLVWALLAAAGATNAASADVVKTFTYANKTGTAANDFHVQFDTNLRPMGGRPAPGHSNEIQNPRGNRRGAFGTQTITGSNPPGGFTSNVMDYTVPGGVMVRDKDQVQITMQFAGRNAGAATSGYFTLNGVRIAGRVEPVSLNEDFSRDRDTGLCSLDLDADPGSPSYAAANIRVWTGLTLQQMVDHALLSDSMAMMLGDSPVSPGSPVNLDLGWSDPASYAVTKYDLSYYDADVGEYRTSTMSYGSRVPMPGPLALAAASLLVSVRRRVRG